MCALRIQVTRQEASRQSFTQGIHYCKRVFPALLYSYLSLADAGAVNMKSTHNKHKLPAAADTTIKLAS